MSASSNLERLAQQIVDLEEAVELHGRSLIVGRDGTVRYPLSSGIPQECDFCNALRDDITALDRMAPKLKHLPCKCESSFAPRCTGCPPASSFAGSAVPR